MISSGRGKGKKGSSSKVSKASKKTGPGPGDQALTDDQRRGLFLQELGKLERLKAEQASAASAVAAQRKAMKADGFNLKDEVDFALHLKRTTSKDDIERLRRNAWAAQALAAPIGTQLGLMLDESLSKDRTPAAERAYQAGKTAGFEGQPQSPPSDAATEQGRRWMDGWQDAQAVILKGFKPLPKDEPGMPSADAAETSSGADNVTDIRPRFLQHKAAEATVQ